MFADKAYFCVAAKEYFNDHGWSLPASDKRSRNKAEKDVPTPYNRFRVGNPPAIKKLVWLDNRKTGLQNASQVRFSSAVESTLLRKTVCCLVSARDSHYLLIVYQNIKVYEWLI